MKCKHCSTELKISKQWQNPPTIIRDPKTKDVLKIESGHYQCTICCENCNNNGRGKLVIIIPTTEGADIQNAIENAYNSRV